jgi:hypothetical protein
MANKQTANKAGPGRPKGSPNKTTALLKEAIIKAAEQVGSDGSGKGSLVGYCVFLAKSEPKAFASLLGRVLPLQLTGPDGEDGEPTAIEMRIVRPKR